LRIKKCGEKKINYCIFSPKTSLIFLETMWCSECSTELDLNAKYCFECGEPTQRKCEQCPAMLVKPDAKYCSECGKQQIWKLLTKKPKLENDLSDSCKSPHRPSARMFHPYNGRQDFATTQDTQNVMNAKVSMIQNMTDLELQKEFGF
jgi:hypothetical protein